MQTRHPDEETLFAFTDGQLAPEEADGIAQHIEACADCAALVAEARGVTAAASRIVGALDGVPANVIPARAPRRLPPWLLAAAVVVLAVGVSSVVVRDADEISQAPASLAAAEQVEEGDAVADVATPGGVAPQSPAVANSPTAAREREPQPAPPVRERTEAVAQGAAGATAERRQFADGAVPSGPPPPPPAAADMAGVPAPSAPRAPSAGKRSGRVVGEVTVTAGGIQAAAGAAARESATAIMQTSGPITPLRITRYRVNPEVVIEVREFGAEPPTTAQPAGSAEFRWRDPAGSRVYVLTGPLPAAELEALARRLGELAIVR